MKIELEIKFTGLSEVLDLGIKILGKLNHLEHQQEKFMSAITDFADKVNANFASLTTDIQALDDKITALNNSQGTLSASDQAALDDIVASSAALVAKATDPTTPVVPTTSAP